ncbi:uncharacterized protein CMU_020110 [Cryptosporidium muris RN66]|uniref:Uncharacterized protein n=1 Tax=Cryptosporidium muris (strain RN66) TaxID=441375 RepID=B6AJD0_CRYMR|nr:uncharacterized protein CMU_020110 [Cryptosporidium muris RN66]EEA08268.1 hypothetical protein, conserved [Cryptosporidium muris RN66]|eukprot:XP_002142617.1 hypothetical protein [Cryptosporidium muris RN66]
MKTEFDRDLSILDSLVSESSFVTNPLVSLNNAASLGIGSKVLLTSSSTASSIISYGIFGLSDPKTELAASFFIGFGGFLSFLLIIALFRYLHIVIHSFRRRSNHSGNRFVVRSSENLTDIYVTKEFANSIQHPYEV